MRAEMSVAGGVRQHRGELSVLVDLGEHRRKWSTDMVWGERENLGVLQHWLYGTRRGNQYATTEDPENIGQKNGRGQAFCFLLLTELLSHADPPQQSISGALMNTVEILDQVPKNRLLTPVKEISQVHLR